MDQTSPPVAVPLGRASVVPRSVSLSPRTGEPRRPWVAWVVLALETIGTGLVGAALLWGMWLSVHHFAEASWPVSYTHLDVYKRQASLANASCSPRQVTSTGGGPDMTMQLTRPRGRRPGKDDTRGTIATSALDLSLIHI